MNKTLKIVLNKLLERTKAIYPTCIDHTITKVFLEELIEGLIEEDLTYLIKDNPVSSLDKIKQKIDDEHSFDNLDYALGYEQCYEDILEILQNGVETDKEQPINFNYLTKVIKEQNKTNNIEITKDEIILSLDGINKEKSSYDLIINKKGKVYIKGISIG